MKNLLVLMLLSLVVVIAQTEDFEKKKIELEGPKKVKHVEAENLKKINFSGFFSFTYENVKVKKNKKK